MSGAGTGSALGPYGAAAGALVGLTSGIMGAISSRNANNRAKALIQSQKDENEQWWNITRNADFTSRSEVQAALQKERELLGEGFKRYRAANAVAGGSDESLAMQQQALQKTIGDTSAQLAASSSAIKDQQEQTFRNRKAELDQQEVALANQQGANAAQAASAGVTAGVNLIGATMGAPAGGQPAGPNPEFVSQAQAFLDKVKSQPSPIQNPLNKIKA